MLSAVEVLELTVYKGSKIKILYEYLGRTHLSEATVGEVKSLLITPKLGGLKSIVLKLTGIFTDRL